MNKEYKKLDPFDKGMAIGFVIGFITLIIIYFIWK
jgi:hypothetical protein